MSKIQIKRGTKDQKVEVVKGMYITLTSHNSLKVDIDKPIDVITDIWENTSSMDIQKNKQNVERYKKALSKLFNRKDMSTSTKRDLCVDARKMLADFITNKNKEYAKKLEFMTQFGKCISEIDAIDEDFASYFKEQIEKFERSIKDE